MKFSRVRLSPVHRAALLGAVVLLFASGCAPKRDIGSVLPTVEAPERWAVEGVGDSTTTNIRQTWWETFSSDELNTFITAALQNNYDLQATAASVQAAAAQARVSTSALLPQLDASGSASRAKQNFIGLPIPGQQGGVPSSTTTSYGVSMNLSWEIDLWGRLRQGRRASIAEFQATQADFAAAQLSLAAQVTKAWFAVIESGQQLRLARATYDSWLDTTSQIEERYRRGIADALSLRQSRSNLASSQASLHVAEFRAAGSKRQLELLLRRYPGARTNAAADLPSVSEPVPVGVPANLIARRPDLAAAERRLIAAGATVGAAKASLYPILNLTGSAGTSSTELSDLLDGDFSVWRIAGAITQPIFSGGRLRANVSAAKAREEQAWNAFGSAVLFALAEVENALDNERSLVQQEDALRVASDEATAALTLARDQYSRGVINFINLLETQRSAFRFESQYLTAQRQRLDARVDLYVALGGGFSVTANSPEPEDQEP